MYMVSTTFRFMRTARGALVSGGAAAVLLIGGLAAWAQVPQPPVVGNVSPVVKSSASAVPAAAAPRALARPAWSELNTRQQAALAPLAPHWTGLSDTQKQKWLAVSRNYDRLSDSDQAKLHDRMIDWAGLSPQQRSQARLNFAETSKLAPDEKKARWEAYQALSEEQRSKLANTSTATRPAGGAGTIRATVPQRLTRLPPSDDSSRSRPRLGVPASEVDHNTLLPQQPTMAPAPSAPAAQR